MSLELFIYEDVMEGVFNFKRCILRSEQKPEQLNKRLFSTFKIVSSLKGDKN